MKKVLLTSTALVAFAGAAAAEVTLSGNAEMGLISGDGGVANTDDNVEFFTDIDVTFTMSGETDGGLVFGATIDLDESDGDQDDVGREDGPDGLPFTDDDIFSGRTGSLAFDGRKEGGETIFISGAFGTLTAGDTDGAVDWALTEVAFNSGSLNDDETEHAGYLGSYLDASYDGQIVRYDYSFGDFGIAISAEMDDNDGDDDDGNVGYALGVKYQLDLGGAEIGLGLGYQTVEFDAGDVDGIGVSANTTFGPGITAGVQYFSIDGESGNQDRDGDHFGVGLGYSAGAISMSANYGMFDLDNDDDSEGFGLSAGYDLGGGASLQAGYGRSEFDDDDRDDFDTFSFGVRMNF